MKLDSFRLVEIGVSWNPQPDITPYELALALTILLPEKQPAGARAVKWEKLPESTKRHFSATTGIDYTE